MDYILKNLVFADFPSTNTQHTDDTFKTSICNIVIQKQQRILCIRTSTRRQFLSLVHDCQANTRSHPWHPRTHTYTLRQTNKTKTAPMSSWEKPMSECRLSGYSVAGDVCVDRDFTWDRYREQDCRGFSCCLCKLETNLYTLRTRSADHLDGTNTLPECSHYKAMSETKIIRLVQKQTTSSWLVLWEGAEDDRR